VRGSWWRLPSVFPSGSRSAVLGSRSSGVGGLAGGVAWAPATDLPPFPDRARRGAGRSNGAVSKCAWRCPALSRRAIRSGDTVAAAYRRRHDRQAATSGRGRREQSVGNRHERGYTTPQPASVRVVGRLTIARRSMPKKPKPLSEQSQRSIEKAEEMGADASEKQFERPVRRLVPPAGVSRTRLRFLLPARRGL
jgi:hypothetical protein